MSKTKQAAKAMRREPTPAERILWDALRRRRLGGLKFRRQALIARFVPDFFCPERKLIVEVDGDYHLDAEQEAQDRIREEHLRAGGLRVLRVSNREILEDLQAVLDRIEAEAARRP